MPFVSITRLRVRSWFYLPAFFVQSVRAIKQAREAEGNRSVAVLLDVKKTFWTRSVWASETAMRAYILAGVHRKVMGRLAQWCDEAAIVHWTQESMEPPMWEDAHRRLQQDGRASKVHEPSEDQRNYRIPAPIVRGVRVL
jgi:hypothetical protein